MAQLRSLGSSARGMTDDAIANRLSQRQAPSVGTLNTPATPQASSILRAVPIGTPPLDAQGGITPGERGQIPGAGGGAPRGPVGGVGATPSTPMTPSTQMNGSIMAPGQQPGAPGQSSGQSSSGVVPFSPMPGYNPGSMVTPQAGGVPGSLGGLKGGGLGVPLQPSNPALDNPISLLMNLLQGGMR